MSRFSRFTNLWRHRALDAEFDDELRFHFEMRVEKNLRRGMSQADAELEARRHLGSTLRAREGMREARIMMWIDTLFRDLSYGARMFRRQPGTTFLAVLTLSLGIGANAVIYSLLHAALIQPLPFPDADRLVAVVDNFRTRGPARHAADGSRAARRPRRQPHARSDVVLRHARRADQRRHRAGPRASRRASRRTFSARSARSRRSGGCSSRRSPGRAATAS